MLNLIMLQAEAAATNGASQWSFWIMMILIFVVFYFFIDRIIALLKRKDEIVALTQKKIRKARQIISWKRKYPIGLFIFILPLLSIPVMAFIIKRFYNHNKKVFSLSFVSVTVFSLLGCILFSPILAIV